ncbi:MAG TPA: serine/threonine-protein kinase [Polyangiales bacterium]
MPRAPRGAGEDESELRAGDLLEGRYQIEDRLGEGGVGYVYRARQIKLHRRVAIKLLQSDNIGDEEMKPRFEREALTLAALSHPHIVSLTDYGTVRGRPYLVMELLEGRTLRDVIDQDGALEPVRALNLVRQILLALAYAHEFGIVHRDLKPANLLLQSLPCHEHIKVLDFGLVKFTKGSYLDSGVQLSRVGFTFGTPAYMSPEHAVGGEVDGRSDLYAVGVLLFELLTGEKPFDGELQDVLRHHFQTPVPKLWDRRAELGGKVELQAFIERAMGKEREERFPDAEHMIRALDALLNARTTRNDRTEQVAVVVRPSTMESLREGAGRLSSTAAQRTRAALVRLRSSAGPLFTRVVRGLRLGASHSYAATLKVSKRSYSWLKPRAVSASRKLAETARSARSELEARIRKTPGEGVKALPAQAGAETAPAPQDTELTTGAHAEASAPSAAADANDDTPTTASATSSAGEADAAAATVVDGATSATATSEQVLAASVPAADVTNPSLEPGFDATLDVPAPRRPSSPPKTSESEPG